MVVGSIIATGGGEEGREGWGRGGKEDIYVLLTEWRRKGNKVHARGQKGEEKEKRGQGMDTKSPPCVKDWAWLWQSRRQTRHANTPSGSH